jgi:DNA repair photolyase
MGFIRPGTWGKIVKVKVGARDVLRRQIERVKEGARISISTATDPYQPAERHYQITRGILTELRRKPLRVSILTKSCLVERDIDLIREISDCEVGFSINTHEEKVRQIFEPYASPIPDRFRTLERLAKHGVRTWVFIAPILPALTDKGLEGFLKTLLSLGVSYVTSDRLNYMKRLPIGRIYKMRFPHLAKKYERVESSYFQRVEKAIRDISKEIGLVYHRG